MFFLLVTRFSSETVCSTRTYWEQVGNFNLHFIFIHSFTIIHSMNRVFVHVDLVSITTLAIGIIIVCLFVLFCFNSIFPETMRCHVATRVSLATIAAASVQAALATSVRITVSVKYKRLKCLSSFVNRKSLKFCFCFDEQVFNETVCVCKPGYLGDACTQNKNISIEYHLDLISNIELFKGQHECPGWTDPMNLPNQKLCFGKNTTHACQKTNIP